MREAMLVVNYFIVIRIHSPYLSSESYLITSYYFISSRNFLEISVLKCGFGGAKRDRTADLLLARQALSQLSYGPILYEVKWWALVDSNHRPHPYQGCALTS